MWASLLMASIPCIAAAPAAARRTHGRDARAAHIARHAQAAHIARHAHARSRRAHGARRRHAGHAASLYAHDVAKLHYAGALGEAVSEKGSASGTLPGSMRVHMIFASTFTGTFTIYTPNGRIDGHGAAKPHGGGIQESFAGTLTVTGGSGRYRHAHGTAHLYGTFNRDNYALTIKTAGTLRY